MVFHPLVFSASFVCSRQSEGLLGCGCVYLKASEERGFSFIPPVALLSEPRPPSQPQRVFAFGGLRLARCVVIVFYTLVFSAFFVSSRQLEGLLGRSHVFFKASEERGFLVIPPVALLSEPRPPSQPLKGLRFRRPSARPMVAVVFYSGASPCSASFCL